MKQFYIFGKIFILLFLVGFIFIRCSKSSTEPEPDPNPTGNLLPGVSYMGYGYDIFGEYAKAEYVKSPILKFEAYQTVVIKENSYNVPIEVQYISVNTADFKSVSGINSFEYQQSLGISASLGVSTPAFSLSVTNIFSEDQYRSNYRAFCTVQNVIRKW